MVLFTLHVAGGEKVEIEIKIFFFTWYLELRSVIVTGKLTIFVNFLESCL